MNIIKIIAVLGVIFFYSVSYRGDFGAWAIRYWGVALSGFNRLVVYKKNHQKMRI
ncbi:hypothetical protein [Riemerella columbipharyngis]|uniref:Uncharacterized protein n=1 Tax=Riemerella columbipharyngis TaxID=1071918 RepID=A0A1G7EZW2_9FLAO|nr:hypothetical protein [Riemerella columbipharyngis]SDE69212.1 hypothetical protein SAMN05421544_11840 [Riemerella columbipharyngis]